MLSSSPRRSPQGLEEAIHIHGGYGSKKDYRPKILARLQALHIGEGPSEFTIGSPDNRFSYGWRGCLGDPTVGVVHL